MGAFIVRPFGVRAGIDFDRVQQELIAPALKANDLEGGTTEVIARAGNIRLDMFERLVLADLVIADVSIHNANVFYELGIRHALRDRPTILIRCRQDDVPFDLRTDRYVEYSKDDPAAAVPLLSEAIRQTLIATTADSPVYLLLPALRQPDTSQLRGVPPELREAVERAQARGDRATLGLLGEEIEGMDWSDTARRLIGSAQFTLRDFRGARVTWEALRRNVPNDPEANQKLATVHQRLGDLPRSTEAIRRVLDRRELSGYDRAECQALLGSNLKAQWIDEWSALDRAARPAAALRSPRLADALAAYRDGFLEDQNHYYSGLNALALATIAVELARQHPEVWAEGFESDEEARAKLEARDADRRLLGAALRTALDGAQHRQRRIGRDDVWLNLSVADHHFLTSTRPGQVAARYREARTRMIPQASFPAESAARQIRIFLELDLLADNARAALKELGVPEAEPLATAKASPRVIVFAGHRIDAPGRERPRFPARLAEAAGAAIRAQVVEEKRLARGPMLGIAGGASGGDILFHEACAAEDVATRLLLALPADAFAVRSVQGAGPEWIERYRALCRRLTPTVLADSEELPRWLADKRDYTIWNRNNLWLLHAALAVDDAEITLIVLWDGRGGDGPGGTADMVQRAKSRDVKVLRIDPAALG